MLTHFAGTGPGNFRALPAIVAFRRKHEIGEKTAYRWLGDLVAGGALPGVTGRYGANDRHVRAQIADMGGLAAGEELPIPPAPPARLSEVMQPPPPDPGSGFAVVANLQECIAAALEIMRLARRSVAGQSGTNIEHAKLLIAGSEHLRRCLQTVVNLHEVLWTMQRLDQFHLELIEVVRTFMPEAADACLQAMERVAHEWANPPRPAG